MTEEQTASRHSPGNTPWLDQGSVFRSISQLPVLAAIDQFGHVDTPLGVVVVSQTCDNVRSARVQVAPIIRLEGHSLADAAKGRTPKYAPLPALGPDMFAGLETVATVGKDALRQEDRTPGVANLNDARTLAQAVGRRYARFAFPDELAVWLDPLRKVAQRKAGSPDSPEGQALARINQVRVRSLEGWNEAPFVLNFTFILDEGELTFDPILDMRHAAELRAWASTRGAAELAVRLAKREPLEQAVLLQALGEAWLAKCASEGSAGVVASYSVDLATADEYSLAAYFDSEALDFDYLSAPPMSA